MSAPVDVDPWRPLRCAPDAPRPRDIELVRAPRGLYARDAGPQDQGADLGDGGERDA